MRKVLTIMWKDVSVLFRDGAALILIIAGPLVLTIGLGMVTGSFSRSGDAPTVSLIPVLIVDQDGGRFAEALIDVFNSDDLSELLAPELVTDEAAALEQVRKGDTAAVVVIPAGFSDSFLPNPATGELPSSVALQVYGDPGSPIRAGIVRSIAEEFANRAQTGVTTIQVALTELAASGMVPPTDLPAVGQSMGESLLGGAGSDVSSMSLIRVRNESVATAGDVDFNPLAYFAPAMALLFLMYAVTLGARTLLSERRDGTLARMLTAPVTTAQVLGGKVAGIFLGGFIQMVVLIVLTTIMFRLNWGNPMGVLLIITSAALAATGWGLLIASASTSAGQITTLGMAVTLIFGILGGSFAPMQQVWPVLDWLSRLTPNRWALDGFVALASGDGLPAIVVPVAALFVMAAVLFAVSAVVFRRRQSALLTG